MSTINNIPFDINRTATERNSTVKRTGTSPVFSSDAIHAIDKNTANPERRKGGDRRTFKKLSLPNNRHLIERRQTLDSSDEAKDAATLLENAHTSGSIIDLEV